MKTFVAVLVLFSCCSGKLIAQDYRFVTADNGLIVRVEPDKGAARLGKIPYATKVLVIGFSGNTFSVVDDGKEISGTWVKVKESESGMVGYVFDGYLSSERILVKQIMFNGIKVKIALEVWNEVALKKVHQDTAYAEVVLGYSPEGKNIEVINTGYKSVKVLQRFENSVTIMNEGPHCDLRNWKHYYSDWVEVPVEENDTYTLYKYTEVDRQQFVKVDLEEFKQYVTQECAGYWGELVANVSHVNEYPSGITMSRIFVKLVLTDNNGATTEKLIVFVLPMGC